MKTNKEESWYKQGWPWFVISLPLAAVIAGVITYQIADNSPHSMVKDDYFKEGLSINRAIEKQQYAREIGVKSVITIDLENQLINLTLSSTINPQKLFSDNHLILNFFHPTQEKYDQKVIMSKLSGNEFIAELPDLPKTNWHIRLQDSEHRWEIKSRWLFPELLSIELTPKS